jgi:hypothetical protein
MAAMKPPWDDFDAMKTQFRSLIPPGKNISHISERRSSIFYSLLAVGCNDRVRSEGVVIYIMCCVSLRLLRPLLLL